MHKDRAQVLLAQAVIMAEVIALIFERVESLVLDSPSGAAAPHDLHDIVGGDLKVGHPTEAIEDDHFLAFGHNLPVLEEVDLDKDLQTGITVLNTIDTRHQQPFRYYESGYPFEYYMVRFLSREKNELAVMK